MGYTPDLNVEQKDDIDIDLNVQVGSHISNKNR